MEMPTQNLFQVLCNQAGDYSLCAAGEPFPAQMTCVFGPDTKAACQHYVDNASDGILKYFYEGLELSHQLLHHTSGKITHPDMDIQVLKEKFTHSEIPHYPQSWHDYRDYLEKNVLPFTVNTGEPKYIGHMTAQLPSFEVELSRIVTILNQNVVKLATSKVLTFLEREAIAMLHRRFYQFGDDFYNEHIQNNKSDLGLVVSGGTQSNVAALWVARNRALPKIAEQGFVKALSLSGYQNVKILVSPLLHYSIQKACSLLGMGTENIEYLTLSREGRVDVEKLQQRIEQLHKEKIKVIALIGIAGATETGSIDPLQQMSAIAARYNIHFHVDASFGGPILFSTRYRYLLNAIDKADSITVCGHKQLYLPIGISLCLFRDPTAMQAISVLADYQASVNSFDFGKNSPEGTRPAMALYLHASLHLLAGSGYEKLIDRGMQLADYIKNLLKKTETFEILWEPEINVVNYRFIPKKYRQQCREGKLTSLENDKINQINSYIQQKQFERGQSFTSMTWIPYLKGNEEVVSLRVVLLNPLIQQTDITDVFAEQIAIAEQWVET